MNQNKAKNYFHVVVSATNHKFLKILTMKARVEKLTEKEAKFKIP